MDIKDILVATLFIALGLSFGYKCIEAVFFGRTYYWTGFMPIGIFSPFFIHWPPTKNSLIKKAHAWFIHVTLGPAFFLLSLMFLATGLDKIGFNGAGMVNTVMTLGRDGAPAAITYSKEEGYKFPILPRMQKSLWKIFSTPVIEKEGQSLTGHEAQDSQMQPVDNNTPPSK